MTSNNNEYNQIDELLQSGQITNAVEFYNYFKNKSNAPSSDFSNLPASSSPIPTSSSSSSISSFSSANKKSSKKCKTTNTLNDYASLLNVPVQNIPKPRFKKTSSTNNLAAYAAPTCHTTPNQNQQYSVYSLNRRSNIFDEYLIGNTDQKPIQNEQDKLEYTSDSKQTISSIFLKSTNSYYQKYKQHQMTQKPELLVDDKKELEKRKEEAINRIIRNERIKEIRLKMHEYELLKEYQNTDVNVSKSDDYSSSKFSKSVEDFSSLNENLSEELTETSSVDHDYQSRLNSKSKKSINNYFTRTYGGTGGNKTIYDEYRSNSNLEDDDEGLFDNDEDYESGIEDDDMTINRYQKKQRVKPGYELYQLNSQSGFNFAPNQSKFHLKISIISAEVKNIVNVLKQAELEVSALQRRVQLLEDDLEKTDERLNQATTKLNEASQAADESERQRKSLEARSLSDDERIATLEKQLAEAQIIAEDADRRYDEVARRLAIMEVDLERAEDRAEAAEAKILELEEELKVVGNNMKSLEVSEQEAIQREESYEEQIRDLSARLKDAEQRADLAERTMAKLQKEVDRLEDELLAEKEKYKNISEELDQTLNELQGY